MKVILGTRGSSLALVQARDIAHQLKKHAPDLEIEIKIIKTKGDKILDRPIWEIGDKGLFVKELETALQRKEIDLAVHSVKDLPALIPLDLCLPAFPQRDDPSDVLVTQENLTLEELPKNAILGTSALRRQSQLLSLRPDLRIEMLRGNVDTRLRKLDEEKYFGIILAKAGLNRLGVDRGVAIPTDILLPSPGQGAIAVEMRAMDKELLQIVQVIDDPVTQVCVKAERSFLLQMEGGCQVPLGALATVAEEELTLKGFLGSPDGKKTVYKQLCGSTHKPEGLGKTLALQILKDWEDLSLEKAKRKNC